LILGQKKSPPVNPRAIVTQPRYHLSSA